MTKTRRPTDRPSLAARYQYQKAEAERAASGFDEAMRRLALLQVAHEEVCAKATEAGVRAMQTERRVVALKEENVALRKVIDRLAQGCAILATTGGTHLESSVYPR